MLTFKKTTSHDPDFLNLVKKLDAELAFRDGDDHLFYAQLNKTASLNHALVAYDNNTPVGCGALREYAPSIMEVKRMYVEEDRRGEGIATLILKQLEDWAAELGYQKCQLETGMNQPEAIALYKKNNYTVTPNYGKYEGVYNSVCFEKVLVDNR